MKTVTTPKGIPCVYGTNFTALTRRARFLGHGLPTALRQNTYLRHCILRHLGEIPIYGTELYGTRSKYRSTALRCTARARNTVLRHCVVRHALEIPIYGTALYGTWYKFLSTALISMAR